MNQFAVSDTASPLKTLYNYLTENGHFKYDKAAADADWSNVWAKDTIIGLGDLIHGDNVWKRYALTLDKYDSLLKIASECYGEDGSSITDENLRTALYNALETANTARAEAEDIQGLGSQYYALYAAVADIDYTLVGQPQVRICTYEQCIQVDDAIAAINELSDLNIATQELVDKANNVYAALGEDDEELKAKLQGYVTNDDLISRAEEFLAFAVKADAVGSITKDSGEAIAAAEEAYAQLSDSLKQEEAVITRYKTLLEGRSLYDVIHAIETLPAIDQLTINDQETVEVLWTSYNALSNELKAQVTNASVLVQANSRMKDLTAANQVEELINSLPDAENISYENGDWDAIQTAYREYNSLTDAQKELVSAEVVEKLDADYEALKQQQSDAQAVQEVIDNIDALPPTDELTLEYNLLIKSIRGLYDSLSTDALRERVTNIETFNNAEARMMELRKTDLLSLIAALPEVEEVSGTNPDGSDIVMTQDMISAIAAAVSTYQAMDEAEQKIFANENPAPYEKMITLDSIAGEYEGYIEEVLAPLAADIALFELPVTRYNMGAAGDLITKYNANEYAKTYLNSIIWEDGTGLMDKMTSMEEQLAALQSVLEQAAKVDALIEALPETVGADNSTDVQKALEEIQTAYDELSEEAQTYVEYLDKWTQAQKQLSDYTEAEEKANEVILAIQKASDAESNNLLSENTVVALKEAEAAYEALLPSEKALVPDEIVQSMETMKDQISEAKTKAAADNSYLTYNGTIPWDVVLEVNRLSQTDDMYVSLKDKLVTDKKASILNAFTVNAYQVQTDGTHKDIEFTGGMSFTIHTDEDLTGKEVVIVIITKDQTVEYLVGEVSGKDITFTVQNPSAFASGEVDSTSGSGDNNNSSNNNNNNNSNVNNNNGGNSNNNNSGNSNNNSNGGNSNVNNNNGNNTNNGSNANNNNTSNNGNSNNSAASGNKNTGASAGNKNTGTSAGTSTGGSTGVPKTGDAIASEMNSMALLVLMGGIVLLLCLKKRKENNL